MPLVMIGNIPFWMCWGIRRLGLLDKTSAVGGCEYTEKSDPGNLQFDWLEVQLHRYRERGIQV